MAENKPISFRADAETVARLEEIAAKFSTKQEMLTTLINAFELQGAKTMLPTSIAGRVDQADAYLNSVNRIILDIADAYKNVKDSTRDQYLAQLTTKDNTITDLQAQIADLKASLQMADQKAADQIRTVEQTAQQAVQQVQAQATAQMAQAQAELAGASKQIIDLQAQVVSLQGQLLAVHQSGKSTESTESTEPQQTIAKQRQRRTTPKPAKPTE